MQYHYKLLLCESDAGAIRILAGFNWLIQLILPHPSFDGIGGVLVFVHTGQQCLRSLCQAEHFDVLRENKAFLFGVQYHRHQRLEVIAHVQQADRFFVFTNLRPGEGFEQFLEGAITAG
jgi:hypothetical protein